MTNWKTQKRFGEKNLVRRQAHVKNGQSKPDFYKAEGSALKLLKKSLTSKKTINKQQRLNKAWAKLPLKKSDNSF